MRSWRDISYCHQLLDSGEIRADQVDLQSIILSCLTCELADGPSAAVGIDSLVHRICSCVPNAHKETSDFVDAQLIALVRNGTLGAPAASALISIDSGLMRWSHVLMLASMRTMEGFDVKRLMPLAHMDAAYELSRFELLYTRLLRGTDWLDTALDACFGARGLAGLAYEYSVGVRRLRIGWHLATDVTIVSNWFVSNQEAMQFL